MSKKTKIIIVVAAVVLVLAALAAVWAIWLQGAFSQRETAISVETVETISSRDNGVSVRFSGYINSAGTYEVEFDSERTLAVSYVAVGDEVEEGEALFSYDTTDLEFEEEQLKLDKQRIQNTIDSYEDQIELLTAARDNASGESFQLQYTTQIQNYETEIEQLEYEKELLELEIDRVYENISDSIVLSPADGVVISIGKPGDTPYLVISSGEELGVIGYASQQDLASLSVDGRMKIVSRADTSVVWGGTITRIDAQTPITEDGVARYPVHITMDEGCTLAIGSHVYMEPDLGERSEGVWLPYYYIMTNGEEKYVWAVDPLSDTIERRVVTVGQYDAATMCYRILTGLALTDEIAWPDNDYRVGDSVRRVSYTEAAATISPTETAVAAETEAEEAEVTAVPEETSVPKETPAAEEEPEATAKVSQANEDENEFGHGTSIPESEVRE